MKKFTTKMLCRAGVVAALYVVLTFALGQFSFGTLGFQIRPAEALTILPLFYVEFVPALYVGCLIANLISPVGPWDIFGGSFITLIAALATYFTGRLIKNTPLKLTVGGFFPVALNAFGIAAIIIYAGGEALSYPFMVLSLGVTQIVWVYALGVPLYFGVRSLRDRGIAAFCDNNTVKPTE